MERKREHLWGAILIAVAALGAFLWLLRDEAEDAHVRVAFEREALQDVRTVAAAQQAFHEARGRYGWAAELRAAGLIDTMRITADGSIAGARYRIDILLPSGTSPRDFVQLAPRSAGRKNPRLAQRHFAVVARPWGAARTGHRSFCLDESGQVYVSEGVSDVTGGLEPPLPELHLSQSRMYDLSGRRWWHLELAGPR